MLSPAEKINFPLILNGSVTYMHVLGFYVNKTILHHNKVKLIPKNFSKNSNLDDSNIYLPGFPSLTDLKLNNILVTPKLVKKVTFTLDFIKASLLIIFQWWFWRNVSLNLADTSKTNQYVSERILFFRLLKGLICGPCI